MVDCAVLGGFVIACQSVFDIAGCPGVSVEACLACVPGSIQEAVSVIALLLAV